MRYDELLERLAVRERKILHTGIFIGFLSAAVLVVVMEVGTDFLFYLSMVMRELRELQ